LDADFELGGGCDRGATGSILVYAYILIYYTKNRGFREGGYLKAEGEGVALRLHSGLRHAVACWRESFPQFRGYFTIFSGKNQEKRGKCGAFLVHFGPFDKAQGKLTQCKLRW